MDKNAHDQLSHSLRYVFVVGCLLTIVLLSDYHTARDLEQSIRAQTVEINKLIVETDSIPTEVCERILRSLKDFRASEIECRYVDGVLVQPVKPIED